MLHPREGLVIAGTYELVRPLARGGMGTVWVAKHRRLNTETAIKLMDPALVASSDARVRFEREAMSASRLESQHVVDALRLRRAESGDTLHRDRSCSSGEDLARRPAGASG